MSRNRAQQAGERWRFVRVVLTRPSVRVVPSGADSGQTFVKMLAIGLVVLLVGCSHSRTGTALNIGVGVAGVADLVTTRQAIARGAVELNPVMGQSLAQQVAIKAVSVGSLFAIAGVTERMGKGWTVLAHIYRSLAIAAQLYVASHNFGVLR